MPYATVDRRAMRLTPRPMGRRDLIRTGAGVAAAGLGAWALPGAAIQAAAQNAPAKSIVWSKDAVRVHLLEDGQIVRTMPCVQNAWKTPDGSYAIEAWSRAISYYQGRRVDLPDFGQFYRRPGASWNIGFHAIPVWSDGPDAGQPIHGGDLLGTEVESEGCLRLAAEDAAHLRSWAPVGTPVVVQTAPFEIDPVEEAVPITEPREEGTLMRLQPSCVPTRRWFWQRRSC